MVDYVMHRMYDVGRPSLSVVEWGSVLSLVTLWQMESLRTDVLELLDSKFDEGTAAHQVYIGRKYNMAEWTTRGMLRLVERPSSLTVVDMEVLGYELSARIAELRESYGLVALAAAQKARVEQHKEILDAWETKCTCRACLWCKKVAPTSHSQPITLETGDLSAVLARAKALAEEYS
jgi:hypothetical protein